jgi:hypothetical protein
MAARVATEKKKALRLPDGRIIHCEWWLPERRQCWRCATTEIPEPGFEAPHRYCTRHAQDYEGLDYKYYR